MTDPPARDPGGFIARNTEMLAPAHVPEVRLHLADEATELWSRTEEELGEMGLPPPFWAFAWAGGQALARHILDHPEIVRGRAVLDFAAGSGLVAIATMKAGAARAIASEIDPFAVAAIGLNAALNGVAVETVDDVLTPGPGAMIAAAADVILAGDVFYERPMAAAVLTYLEAADARGAAVLIGDPGRSYLPVDRLAKVATYEISVIRALEDADVKRTTAWRLR